MTLPSDRLQLLFERHLELLVKFRTQLLNHSCYEDAMEVDGLISQLHSGLENDNSLHEFSINCTSNETVVHDAPSGPVLSIPETCPVMVSNSIIPETACTDSSISSSRKDPIVLPGNVSQSSNNNQEPGTVLLDADYQNDPLPTNDAPHKFDNNISEDLNSDDFELNGVYLHYLVDFTEFPVQYVLNAIKLIVIWVYEDPTLYRGGG
ncbi:unnamed protein product [Schistosoma mattheei]|uniref:Uncharacterized protein n=1 Tax=Schistosoma mattheei TaxID=31246 RepID=A0A183PEZ9_9TREM|nr:unnamed protein product [Schistosoma mattheei]